MPALDANQGGDPTSLVCADDLPGTGDEGEVLRVEVDEAFDDVYLLEGELDGVEVLRGAGHVGGPELRAQQAGAQARDVCLGPGALRPRLGAEERAHVQTDQAVLDEFAEVPGKIIVCVYKRALPQ